MDRQPPEMREQQRQPAQQEGMAPFYVHEQPPMGITGAQLQERLAQIFGNDLNPWQHRSIQFQAAGTIQQSPQTATPGYAPQGDWMPPYAWHPQHPNHMPPRRNYDQPMDAAVAPEYYAHMGGVPLQSAPPVSSHAQAMTNALHATAPNRTGGDYGSFPSWHPTRSMPGLNPYQNDEVLPTGLNIVTEGNLSAQTIESLEAIHQTQ